MTNAGLRSALEWLERERDAVTLANMGPRYGIHTDRAFGVPMRPAIGKRRSLLTAAAIEVAERLSTSDVLAVRRVGRPALNDLRRSPTPSA